MTLERFVRFFQALKLPRDPDKCNRDYLTALGAGAYPLPHAEAVCRELVRRGHKLYIVTNAVASVQRSRLHRSAVAPYITDASSPRMPGPASPAEPTSTMFSPTSPVSHGRIACSSVTPPPAISGAPTTPASPCCWYDPHGTALPENLHIDYRITDLSQLYDIV